MSTTFTVEDFDHLVLWCADIEITLAWYIEKLGLAPVRVDEWRAGTVFFPSVRISPHSIIDFLEGERPSGRLDHFCLVVKDADLDALAASGEFDVVDGPATRYGARGDGRSLYVRDPDGTIVELRTYDLDDR